MRKKVKENFPETGTSKERRSLSKNVRRKVGMEESGRGRKARESESLIKWGRSRSESKKSKRKWRRSVSESKRKWRRSGSGSESKRMWERSQS